MDSDGYTAILVVSVLTVLPIVSAGVAWLLIDPATAWQKMAAILVCGAVGFVTIMLEMMIVAVVSS